MPVGQVTPGQPSHNPEADLNQFRPALLLTRPVAPSARFAAEFRARMGQDWPVVIAPLMQTVFSEPDLPNGHFDGIIFTSETAVRGFARLTDDRETPAYCVGARTADAATNAGFSAILGPGDAVGLARQIAQNTGQRLLYPRGMHVAQDMENLLVSAESETISVVVYAQHPCALTTEAQSLLATGAPVLLPLFSRRSALLFAKAARAPHKALLIAALSPEIAEATTALKPLELRVAARPDGEALLNALADLANRLGLG